MGSYPDFETLVESPNKNRLLEVRRALRSILSLVFLFACSVFVVYLINYYAQRSGTYYKLPLLRHISPRYLAIIPLLFFLETMRRLHDDLYIFSLHRITHLKGRLSLSYNIPVVKYVDIRAINVSQDFMGRVLNYGTVSIGTAAHDGNELALEGVRDPEQLAILLDKLRSNSIQLGESISADGLTSGSQD